MNQQATLKATIEAHLAEEGFGPDGGVAERWAVTRVGPVPICIPNTAARRKAVPYHDANHVVSGYEHDLVGESEIGAWELGGGCRGYVAAWVLNWAALVPGLVVAPRRMFRAFVRGRHSRNLYAFDLDQLLELPLAEVRHRCRLVASDDPTATIADGFLFAVVVALAPVVGSIPVVLAIVTSPAWLADGAHRHRRIGPAQ